MNNHEFTARYHNRMHFPDRHIIVCEDDLQHQLEFATLMRSLFSPQGKIDISFVPESIFAAHIISTLINQIKVIILDHDMPYGNGSDLINWMAKNNHKHIPIITASGHLPNNPHMRQLCDSHGITVHEFTKQEVLNGAANDLIKQYAKS